MKAKNTQFLRGHVSIVSCLMLLFFLAHQAQAQNSQIDMPKMLSKSSAVLAIRSSPFDPPEETDTNFVVDDAPGLDTGCTFRSGGPLVFDIEITRFVGDINPDGTLQDPNTLIQNGVLSKTATLILPAFDVDYDISDRPSLIQLGVNPERDRISFNGVAINRAGTSEPFLIGQNNTWILNEFVVPIEIVKFPDRAALGSTPAPRKNTITIDVDQANIGNFIPAFGTSQFWCTAIDWAALEFQAMSPIVLVHGMSANNGTWSTMNPINGRTPFIGFLDAGGFPFDNSISLLNNGNNSVADNARELNTLYPSIAERFGTDSINIIAHSQGGLNTRQWLATFLSDTRVRVGPKLVPRPLQVIAFITLDTPHLGSVLADYVRDSRLGALRADPTNAALLIARTRPLNPNIPDLTVGNATAFNARNNQLLSSGITYLSVGADANANGNFIDANGNGVRDPLEVGVIDDGEFEELLGAGVVSRRIAQILYTTLGTVSTTSVTRIPRRFLPDRIIFTETPTATFQENDLSVTVTSAHGSVRFTNLRTFVDRNHSSVKDRAAASLIIQVIPRLR